jgi:hypothetical protein
MGPDAQPNAARLHRAIRREYCDVALTPPGALAIALPSGNSLRVSPPNSAASGTTATNQPAEATAVSNGLPAGPIGERLDSQLDWYDTKARHSQLWYLVLKVAQIIVAAAIPVLAAAGASAAVAGGLGAVVVVLEGIQQLFQFQQNWTRYRSTAEALKREKYLFLAGADPYSGPAREPLLATRVEALVSAETSAWRSQRDDLAHPDTSDKSSGS